MVHSIVVASYLAHVRAAAPDQTVVGIFERQRCGTGKQVAVDELVWAGAAPRVVTNAVNFIRPFTAGTGWQPELGVKFGRLRC